jgi:hypothetical protein
MPRAEATRLGFFRDCVEHEFAEAEGGRAFYFKLNDVPAAINAMYSRSTDPAIWEPWWLEYLTTKYAALARLNRHPKTQTKTLQREFSLTSGYARVVQNWRTLAPIERHVLKLRLEQIGDLDLVHQTWYDEFPSFLDWVESCDAHGGLLSSHPTAPLTEPLEDLLAQHLASDPGPDDTRGREVIDLLEEMRRVSEGSRDGASREDVFLGASADGAASVDPIATLVAQALLSLRARGERGLEHHIKVLLAIVKAQFRASVCDFLLLREYPGREQLELFVTTADVPAEKLYALEDEAAYTRPTGITGSVLVARRNHALFHVGTNALAVDPRQSRQHKSVYTDLYGDLANFWVFPVYAQGRLLGALRVVNRLDEHGAVAPWPYLVRRRIAALVQAVGVFLDDCELPAAVETLSSQTAPAIANYVERPASARARVVEEMVAREAIPVDADGVIRILDALSVVAQIRIETRGIAMTAVIVAPERLEDIREIIRGAAYQPLYGLPSLVELDRWSRDYPDVAIVITTTGLLAGTLTFSGGAASRPDTLSVQRGVALALTQALPGTSSALHIWHEGAHVADYAFIPRLGSWQLRDLPRGREAIARKLSKNSPVIERVLRHAIALSYDHGSVIVLLAREDAPARFPISGDGAVVDEPLDQVDAERFAEHATRDGAVVISLAGNIESAEEMLPNSPPPRPKPALARALAKSQRDLTQSGRGMKHQSALTGSAHFPNSAVICISENRTVCAFVAGEIVLWDF